MNRPASSSARTRLPGAAQQIIERHPALWAAFQRLGEAATQAGPLDERTRRLIHLALSIASGSEGATHSHARRALSEGIAREEIEHVALLAVTTLGWSHAVRGLTWVQDVTHAPQHPAEVAARAEVAAAADPAAPGDVAQP